MKSEKVYLCAPVQEMARDEVRALIGEERYQAIKAHDPHPCFVALTAGHEGESRGRILSRGAGGHHPNGVPSVPRGTKKRWSAERIRELARHLAQAPVYLFHNADNSPRRKVGEIVAATVRRLKGRLHALGVAYIADPEARERIRSGELDTCSIEAELEFSRRRKAESWLVEAVRRVTGLALGSRAFASPGFPGAGLLAVVQEFEPVEGGHHPNGVPSEKKMQHLENQLQQRDQRIQELEAELAQLKQQTDWGHHSDGVPSGVSEQIAKLVEEQVQKHLEEGHHSDGVPSSQRSFPVPPESDQHLSQPWQRNPLIPKEN